MATTITTTITTITTITLLYFVIGFISDLCLNYLSHLSSPHVPRAVKALEYYFDRKTIKFAPLRHIISAVNAGLTIVITLIITMLISTFLLGFLHPTTLDELWRFILLAFCTGYAADYLIYKLQLFGTTLNPYYKLAGVGVWGALAFLVSIIIAYIIISYIFIHIK